VPQTSIRNVIFDFGGVLLRWQPLDIIERLYAGEAVRGVVWKEVFQHPDWIEMDRGTLEEEAAARNFADRTGRSLGEMRELLRHVKESLTPIPETVAIVRELAGRGVPLYGLSNMSAATFAYLRDRYDHWEAFRGIVISGEIRMIKPDPRIFEYTLRTHALDAPRTVFIDDSRANIEAAQRLGFRTILFEHPGQCAGELDAVLAGRAAG
jgi:putative hydrolase of the HAD superfamily